VPLEVDGVPVRLHRASGQGYVLTWPDGCRRGVRRYVGRLYLDDGSVSPQALARARSVVTGARGRGALERPETRRERKARRAAAPRRYPSGRKLDKWAARTRRRALGIAARLLALGLAAAAVWVLTRLRRA